MTARPSAHPHHARLALSLLFLLMVLAVPASGQEKAALPFSIDAGRLYTTEGREIVFSKLAFTPDSASYQKAGERRLQLVPASTVLRVEKQTGSEALKWGVIMGLSGLLGAVLGVAQAESSTSGLRDKVEVSSGAKAGIVGGATAVCAGIGLAMGAGHKTYATVYENPSFKRP
jgi:hypothetical protein